ncbi:MAG: hypothetical protein V3R99_09095 [Thermoguttaceae bacterium]
MASSTYFLQECPTCGRRSQVRVEYLGRQVVCQHCQAKFMAIDPVSLRFAEAEEPNRLLRRADELLASTPEPKPGRRSFPR